MNEDMYETMTETQENVPNNQDLVLQIEKFQKENNELNNKYLEIQKENYTLKSSLISAKNMLQMMEKNHTIEINNTIENFSKKILVLLDDFMKVNNMIQDKNILAGIAMLENKLISIFQSLGITENEIKVGDIFDVNIHNALSSIDGDGKSNTISQVLSRSFKLNNKIIKIADVIIYK